MFGSEGTHKRQMSSKVDVPTLFLKGSEANGMASTFGTGAPMRTPPPSTVN